MAVSSTIFLPDGQTFTVQPVFGGLFFKSLDMNKHHPSLFPVGWTVVIHTEDGDTGNDAVAVEQPNHANKSFQSPSSQTNGNNTSVHSAAPLAKTHSFTHPTLQNDTLYISSLSLPSSADYEPAVSPTRQIAMMLWTTLYWYFHQQPPSSTTLPPTESSRSTAPHGRPRGDWRVHVRRDGVLRGRNLLSKLERMGLIASLDSSVGSSVDDTAGDEWAAMFVSQRAFWQIPGRLFLFTLQPVHHNSSIPGSPVSSRPGSPLGGASRNGALSSSPSSPITAGFPSQALLTNPAIPLGPFFSASHLPTYFPPPPLQYTFSNSARHPVRPKPPRMGEVFYTRYVPSVAQYLSFRVASSSAHAVPYSGPVSPQHDDAGGVVAGIGTGNGAGGRRADGDGAQLTAMCDSMLVHMWLSKPRVAKFWGGPAPTFLTNALASRHSFPVVGLWDGVPFGYFEIYWVKEDVLGRYVDADEFDRGIHVFIGEEWARGRVALWLGALVHWIFCSDFRTRSVCIEPRVDNERFIQLLQHNGFVGEKEISFPHKQSWFGRLRRENWEGPAL